MLRESNAFVSEVTVWGNRSLFAQATRSPRCTVNSCGLNCKPSIVTVRVWLGDCRSATEMLAPDPIIAARSKSQRAEDVISPTHHSWPIQSADASHGPDARRTLAVP